MNIPTQDSAPTWLLDVPFEMRSLASSMGARWNRQAKATAWQGNHLPEALRPFRAMPMSLEWARQYALNGRHLEPAMRLEPPFQGRDHQMEAARIINNAYGSGLPGFLLADEVGVGKTMSAWEFAMMQHELSSVLVITTAGAIAHWRHTILHAGWRPDHRIMIINYDRLGKLFEVEELSSNKRKGKRKRIAREGIAPTYDLVLADESHKGKNPDSARGKMMRKITDKSRFALWMSATAGQNPVEMIYLARLLGKATGSRVSAADPDAFLAWCKKQGLGLRKGAYGAIEWDRNEEDIARIHGWLFGGKHPMALRRLPQQIAGWPAMERQPRPVELDGKSRMAYAKLWSDFREEEMRIGSSKKSKTELARARENNRMRLRQEASWLRVPSTVGQVSDLLDQGKRVAISVAFLETQQEMARLVREKLDIDPALIHGKQSKIENEAERMRFQTGKTPVVIFTVEEAISLHQGEYEDVPRVMLLHDVRWSAIQLAQIEGRCHRDGALAPVWWLMAEDTVEVEIGAAMVSRVIAMKGLHGDPVGDLKAVEEVIQAALKRAPATN